MIKPQITKLTGGLYTVKYNNKYINARPRGIFRKNNISPCVGDYVELENLSEEVATISEIHDRKNHLIRPPVANIDYMVLVVSVEDPAPNFLVLDKLIATMEYHDIKTVIAVTKTDLASPEIVASIYGSIGYKIFTLDNSTGNGSEELSDFLGTSLCAFAGNSGVGKTSLLNSLEPSLNLLTGTTSKKLGRGKHTTRHVEIFELSSGLRIADTPGFSSVNIIQTTDVIAENLAQCFVEFVPYITNCKFSNCKHLSEIGCAVKEAVDNKIISSSRYESYKQIYATLEEVNEWERQ